MFKEITNIFDFLKKVKVFLAQNVAASILVFKRLLHGGRGGLIGWGLWGRGKQVYRIL